MRMFKKKILINGDKILYITQTGLDNCKYPEHFACCLSGDFFSCFLSEILFVVVSSTGVCKIIFCLGVTPSRPSQANRNRLIGAEKVKVTTLI